jgi:dolichol kinase
MLDRVIVVSLLAGLIGALAELVPIAKLDDNFTLPVMSSLGLYILFYLFGLFANN